MFCKHLKTRYCRVQTAKGDIFFSKQCLGCLELVKTDEHGGKLFLKPSEIPINETIHAFVFSEGGEK